MGHKNKSKGFCVMGECDVPPGVTSGTTSYDLSVGMMPVSVYSNQLSVFRVCFLW